jgi:hypothetical protein
MPSLPVGALIGLKVPQGAEKLTATIELPAKTPLTRPSTVTAVDRSALIGLVATNKLVSDTLAAEVW